MSKPDSDSKEDDSVSSYHMMLDQIQRQRSVLRQKWANDYATHTSKGATDIQGFAQFAEVTDKVKHDFTLTSNECILILPQPSQLTRRRSTATNDPELIAAAMNQESKQADSQPKQAQNVRIFKLPLLHPTVGHSCIDVRQLFGKSNITTYDPGFMSTASCHSAITYIDGPKGVLLHRGYRIEEICKNSNFVELSFLLLYGDLPSKQDLDSHRDQLIHHTLVHEKLIQFYKGFRYNAHPMAIMCAVVGALSSFYHNEMDIRNAEHRLLCTYRIIAKIPTLAAMAYKTSIGQPIVYPQNKFTFAENFLHMLFALPAEPYKPHPTVVEALDTFLMLHADHEQNASTSTVRIAGSSHANPFACIASGITALWGPAHGGANEAVLRMLDQIGNKDNIPKFIAKAKDKKDPFRLMGFGHRVYKNYDPRAKVMQKICWRLLNDLKIVNNELFELAMELEKIALNDEYFIKRKLFPNVDFYSGIVLKAIGIPTSMFTVLFAVARTVGWIAHWKEMIEDPKQRIGRPRQLYLGMTERKYVPLEKREDSTTKVEKTYD